MSHRVRKFVERAALETSGSCHVFRHTAASVRENGADVRMVQELLGHASLEATEMYTHVSIRKLPKVHAATPPGAKLGRQTRRADEEAREGGEARTDELVAAVEEGAVRVRGGASDAIFEGMSERVAQILELARGMTIEEREELAEELLGDVEASALESDPMFVAEIARRLADARAGHNLGGFVDDVLDDLEAKYARTSA